MNQICRDIFRAIHEGKWLKIEYRNKADQITKYWIGIVLSGKQAADRRYRDASGAL